MTLELRDTFEAESFVRSNASLQQYIDLRILQKNVNFQYLSNAVWHYFGLIQNNKKHGDGVLLNTKNGKMYVGTWENGMKHGEGFERFSNQAEYKGSFLNGKAEGYGEYVWPNGESYKGEWVNGMKHGKGEWTGTNSSKYSGEWRFGKVEG